MKHPLQPSLSRTSRFPLHAILDMYINPFAAAWGAPQSRESNDWVTGNLPPTFGVLPSMEDIPSAMTFSFNMTDRSILNCRVLGNNAALYFTIATNSTTTAIYRRNGELFSVINWQSRPTIQANGVLDLQRTGHWLRLSQDRKYVEFICNCSVRTPHPPRQTPNNDGKWARLYMVSPR